MLTLALAATLVGFGLLVVALITANFWLAVACIVVCVIGLVVLLVDILRAGRGGGGVGDEPLFTIRDRSDERTAPLLDAADEPVDEPAGPNSEPIDTSLSGLGSIVAAEPVPHVDAESDEPAEAGAAEPDGPALGDTSDYIRSVTGSFPSPTGPSGAWPVSAEPVPAEVEPEPASGPVPTFDAGPATGPILSASPYVGRRRRGMESPEDSAPEESTPAESTPEESTAEESTGVQPAQSASGPAAASDAPSEAAPSPVEAAEPPVDEAAEKPAAERTFVVHDNTGPLPKITFVGDDE